MMDVEVERRRPAHAAGRLARRRTFLLPKPSRRRLAQGSPDRRQSVFSLLVLPCPDEIGGSAVAVLVLSPVEGRPNRRRGAARQPSKRVARLPSTERFYIGPLPRVDQRQATQARRRGALIYCL